jgi:hypothetical protein
MIITVVINDIEYDVDYYKDVETLKSVDLNAIYLRGVDILPMLNRDYLVKILDAALDAIDENQRADRLMLDLIKHEAYGV